MAVIKIGTQNFSPSKMEWGLQDVSGSDAGRTEDGYMFKNRVTQKRKLQLEWWGIGTTEAARILQAFNPEYINVTYFDPLIGDTVTKTFYTGDKSAPVKMWTAGKKLYETISFNIIER